MPFHLYVFSGVKINLFFIYASFGKKQNKTDKDVLLDFFKNRIGVSVLAYMIIEKYTLGHPETTHGSYDTISDYRQADSQLDTATKEALKTSLPLKEKDGNSIYFPKNFNPMGSSPREER